MAVSAKNVVNFPKGGKVKVSRNVKKPLRMKRAPWSADRPQKPSRDPMLDNLVRLLRMDNRSYYAKANLSGLSETCIKNIEEGVTQRPQGVTIWMLYDALGYGVTFSKK